jgi:cellobiose phosphorylase
MKYGYFDDIHREYVITDPKTPVKWINYIGTLAFGGFVDHTGGALICKGDPALNRITKYITQLPASDFKGETLYLRVRQPDSFRVFSPFFVPTLDSYQHYECHVGLGYTRIISDFYGLRTEILIFIPPGEEREIRDIKVTNLTGQPLEVDAIPVVEYTHFDSLKQLTNADWVPQTMQSRADWEADGFLVLKQYAFMRKDFAVNYFTSSLPVSSFESDRKKFLGDNEYGTWANPLSLKVPELSNYEANRGDNIAALLHHLGVLQSGETRRLITQLGQAENITSSLPAIHKYRQPKEVEAAFEALNRFWDGYLSSLQVNTPDESMNHMLNIHNPRQCFITKNWSRYLSYYQLGYGSRGLGFRDSSQDVMGVMANIPDQARDLIRLLLHVQKLNGSAMHQFYPLTMEASSGDASESDSAPRYYSDDHLWIVLAVTSYLKETGDIAFLDEVIPYYDSDIRPQDKAGQSLEAGTVLDHLKRAIAFTHSDTGAHGLPLLGFADWNDTVNLRAGAESVFTADLYGKALLEMIALGQHLGDQAMIEKFSSFYQEMREKINSVAWDGEWYTRYFDHDGTPLGSRTNTNGQIYVNSQTWAVISAFAPLDRAQQAMQSVHKHLNTRNGIKLSTPGFNGFDPQRGGVTTYPPGTKENGGIFLHTNPWAMIAETILGNGDRAFEYYNQINPGAKNNQADKYECEPYVYPQNILGDEHPQFGLARNSWLTGTASWVYQAATMFILGIRPTYRGLLVDPCIPPTWNGFSVKRLYRGSWYEIEVRNPDHISKGIKSINIDGTEFPTATIIPIFNDNKTHSVIAIMG